MVFERLDNMRRIELEDFFGVVQLGSLAKRVGLRSGVLKLDDVFFILFLTQSPGHQPAATGQGGGYK